MTTSMILFLFFLPVTTAIICYDGLIDTNEYRVIFESVTDNCPLMGWCLASYETFWDLQVMRCIEYSGEEIESKTDTTRCYNSSTYVISCFCNTDYCNIPNGTVWRMAMNLQKCYQWRESVACDGPLEPNPRNASRCRQDKFGCAVAVRENSGRLELEYGCVGECGDEEECRWIDDTTYRCCCSGINCNNQQLAVQMATTHCPKPTTVPPLRCHNANKFMSCGQEEEREGETRICLSLEDACVVRVVADNGGLNVSQGCSRSCEEGCKWLEDTYTCCCTGDRCNSAAAAVHSHCKRIQCIQTIQTPTCSSGFESNKSHLCNAQQHACGVELSETGISYSCMSSCPQQKCKWIKDKYTCCCNTHNCNNQQMAEQAIDAYCKGQQHTHSQGNPIIMICWLTIITGFWAW